jgi:hypothetical protein
METFARFNSEPKDWKWNHKDPDETENGVCDLCGYAPLRWVYTIELVTPGHPSQGHKLGIGSECVGNFFLADEYEKSLFRQTEGRRKKTVAARNKLMTQFGVSRDEADYIIQKFPSLEVRRDPDKGPRLQWYGRHMGLEGRTRYGWYDIEDDEVRRLVRQKRKGDIRLWMEHLDEL